jgi:hypothetical protein
MVEALRTDVFRRRKKPDSREQSQGSGGPGAPQGDTLSLVPVIGITEDMIITREGTFVVMLELPTIDMGAGGQDFAYWTRRYQSVLERLPAGINVQLTVQLEPRDPAPDLEYFLERAHHWQEKAAQDEASPREAHQAKNLSEAAQSLTSFVALWFDEYRPITWRTIYSLFWKSPLRLTRGGLLGFRRDGHKSDGLENEIPAAREALYRTVSIVTTAFSEGGIPLRLLTPAEMCQVVWRGLHPASNGMPMERAADMAIAMAQGREPARVKPPALASFHPGTPTEELAVLLAPSTMVEKETSLEVDGVRVAGYVIQDFRPHQPAMVHRLANLPGGWTGTVFMEFAEPSMVAGPLREREVQLSASEMLKASKGMLQSYSNQQEVAAVQSQRMAMETVGQTPVFIRFFVMRTAPDDQTLEHRVRDLESLLTTLGVSSFPARYTQRALWQSTLPTGEMVLKQKPRNMTPQSLATFFWPAQRRYMDDSGIYVGIDQETQLPIRVDPFGEYKEKTPTFLALGRPGAGKSVWLRSMMLSALVAGNNVMAVDIEGEMQEFCDLYGGRYIEIGGLTGERINVLDIPPDSENPLEHGTKHLVAFCEAVRGRAIPKGAEWNALAEAYRLALEDRQLVEPGTGRVTREWRTEDAPLLKDIARILANSRRSEAGSLAEMLHPYADGLYREYFNTPTTFDIRNERLVVFGMRSANESGTWDDQELQVYLWQVMGLMWSEVLRRNEGRPETANHVMLDEVWALLRTPGGAAAIENMARRFRKRRGALWMASQQIGEFLEKEHGRQILSVVGAKLLMGVSPFEAKRMQGPFELSDYYIDMLTQLGHGEGLLQLSNAILKVWIRIPQDLGVF